MKRVIVIGLVMAGCSGDGDPAPQDRQTCARLRDRVVELRVAEATQDQDAHRRALREALGDSFVTRCVDEPPERFACEMNAATIDALRDCSSAP